MTNLPFAFFYLGASEMIILVLIGVVGVAVVVAVVIANAGKKDKDD